MNNNLERYQKTAEFLNMQGGKQPADEHITRLHAFGADRNLPKYTDAHSRKDNQQNNNK